MPYHAPLAIPYARIPVNKAQTMRYLMEMVQRGYRYWISGVIPIDKAAALARKFKERYHCDVSESTRWRNKKQGEANTVLIMYPQVPGQDQPITHVLWWLLITSGTGSVFEEEYTTIQDAHDKHGRLRWQQQFVLVHRQRPREYGGQWHLTWEMQKPYYVHLHERITGLASGRIPKTRIHATRTEQLEAEIADMLRMPGFNGVRLQEMSILKEARKLWHQQFKDAPMNWPEHIPYVDKGQKIFRPTLSTESLADE